MKTLKQLKENAIYLKANLVDFQLKSINRKNIDFDVYLPTLKYNLQRPFVWSLEQKRELIWSVFLERNIPNISLFIQEIDGVDLVQVIDGKQRLSALVDFYNNKFTLLIEENEYFYSELPNDYKSEIECRFINCYVIYDKLTDLQKAQWFNLINFSGTEHK